MLAIRLPEDIELRLGTLAAKTGRTKTFYAREAILEYLDDLEDLYLAEKRLNNIKNGKVRCSLLFRIQIRPCINRFGLKNNGKFVHTNIQTIFPQ